MVIGTIVEGPSDRLVLQAIINTLCPGEHRYLPLQPTPTFGETGTGWKGVRRFCREIWQREGSDLAKFISGDTGSALDLLVIHVDADVAAEVDLQEGIVDPVEQVLQPCPPVTNTANNIRRVVTLWLNVDVLPPQVVLAIPAQDTETWVFAAFFPHDPLCARDDYECITGGNDPPAYRLTLRRYGRRLRRTDGKVKKPTRVYRDDIAPRIARDWNSVCRICAQACAFTQALSQLV